MAGMMRLSVETVYAAARTQHSNALCAQRRLISFRTTAQRLATCGFFLRHRREEDQILRRYNITDIEDKKEAAKKVSEYKRRKTVSE